MEYKNLPDLKGWATLRAVIDKGGVSNAAQALNVGQPAVTKRLRALEECYGMALTERVGGRLRLNKAGEQVYLLAVQTLDRQLALKAELEDMAHGKTHLHLEVTFAIGEHFLPGFLLQFAEQHPEFKIDSRLVYNRDIQAHLVRGDTDVALLERAPDHPDLMVQKWMDDELWMVCSPRHPLGTFDTLDLEQLPAFSYVLRERTSSPRRDLTEALERTSLPDLEVAFEVGSTDAIVNVLMPGHHVSFLPRFAVEDHVKSGRLHHVKVTGFHIIRTLWIARHRDNLNHAAADAFISMIREGRRALTIAQKD